VSASVAERSPGKLREHLTLAHDKLAEMTDRVSEALAAIHEATLRDVADIESVCRDRLNEVNLLIWQLRWVIGPSGGEVTSVGDYEAADSESTHGEGGAS